MLSCQELTEIVTNYVEGSMGLMDRLRFRMHIGMCKHCREYVRQMRQTAKTLGRLPPEAISEEAQEVLMERFKDWKGSR